MPKFYVKDSGSWKQVLQLWVKQSGTWKGVTTGLVTSGGIGKQFYPDTTSTVIYSAPGSYTYTVPAGVSQLEITYPTLSAVTTQTITVTPGASYTVTIGAYGSGSSFGALLTTSGYTKTVGSWSGNIDAQNYITFGVGTASGNTYSGTGDASTLSSGAAAAGCYYSEASEGGHGDLEATIGITTALSATFVNTLQASIINFSGRGDSGANINTQPSADNSFRATVYAYDGGYSEGSQSWNLQLQQVISLQIRAIGANFQTYTTAGSYSFVVPAGVTSLTATIVGGGGGGGGFFGSGDNHAGGAGGSGGYYTNQSISVTPGETLTLTVGAGGGSASFEFNGGFICTGTVGTSGSYWNGTAGGTTSIYRGATNLLTATGGQPGIGSGPGDNCSGSSGAGGSPNGVNGGSINCNRNSYGATQGGSNGTGYGTGGNGNGSPNICPTVGGTGYIGLTW